MKLGKKPARHAMALQFGDVFYPAALPTAPKQFGSYQLIPNFYGLGNDKFGCCVWAGAAHEHMMWTVEGGAPRSRFTIHDVLSDYTAVTGFDATKPETDQGTDMLVAAAYRRKTGILDATGIRHKVDAYSALKPGNVDQLALAAWICGGVGLGILFPESAMQQFNAGQPWDVVPNSQVNGGHYVPCLGRDENGLFVVVTWGKIQKVTPAFISRYMDEGVAYISIERMKNRVSPEGFASDRLVELLAQI